MSIHKADWIALAGFAGVCLVIPSLGGIITASSVTTWYPLLQKPVFNPPNWVFGPVWTLLYVMIAIAGWQVYRCRNHPKRIRALVIYGLQLALNIAWSFLFFGLQSPLAGLLGIIPLLVVIVANIRAFRPIRQRAAWLLVPYFLWVGFAAVLNASIWWLN